MQISHNCVLYVRETDSTFVVGQQVEESLSNLLPRERLNVLQPVQQRADGVILSLSVHGSHSLPVRKLTLSQEVQDVPLDRKIVCSIRFLLDEPSCIYICFDVRALELFGNLSGISFK